MKATARLNWTVAGCLGLFLFVYSTVVSCVVREPYLRQKSASELMIGISNGCKRIQVQCHVFRYVLVA